MERPKTSKPHNLFSGVKRNRTKMLSQKEYIELQNSDKKTLNSRYAVLDKASVFSDKGQALTLKSEHKKKSVTKSPIHVFDENVHDSKQSHELDSPKKDSRAVTPVFDVGKQFNRLQLSCAFTADV